MRDELLTTQKTIVIDIEGTLVTRVDIRSLIELNKLRTDENFKDDYIIVDDQSASDVCCQFKGED